MISNSIFNNFIFNESDFNDFYLVNIDFDSVFRFDDSDVSRVSSKDLYRYEANQSKINSDKNIESQLKKFEKSGLENIRNIIGVFAKNINEDCNNMIICAESILNKNGYLVDDELMKNISSKGRRKIKEIFCTHVKFKKSLQEVMECIEKDKNKELFIARENYVMKVKNIEQDIKHNAQMQNIADFEINQLRHYYEKCFHNVLIDGETIFCELKKAGRMLCDGAWFNNNQATEEQKNIMLYLYKNAAINTVDKVMMDYINKRKEEITSAMNDEINAIQNKFDSQKRELELIENSMLDTILNDISLNYEKLKNYAVSFYDSPDRLQDEEFVENLDNYIKYLMNKLFPYELYASNIDRNHAMGEIARFRSDCMVSVEKMLLEGHEKNVSEHKNKLIKLKNFYESNKVPFNNNDIDVIDVVEEVWKRFQPNQTSTSKDSSDKRLKEKAGELHISTLRPNANYNLNNIVRNEQVPQGREKLKVMYHFESANCGELTQATMLELHKKGLSEICFFQTPSPRKEYGDHVFAAGRIGDTTYLVDSWGPKIIRIDGATPSEIDALSKNGKINWAHLFRDENGNIDDWYITTKTYFECNTDHNFTSDKMDIYKDDAMINREIDFSSFKQLNPGEFKCTMHVVNWRETNNQVNSNFLIFSDFKIEEMKKAMEEKYVPRNENISLVGRK